MKTYKNTFGSSSFIVMNKTFGSRYHPSKILIDKKKESEFYKSCLSICIN